MLNEKLKNSWQSQAAKPSGKIEKLKFLAEPRRIEEFFARPPRSA